MENSTTNTTASSSTASARMAPPTRRIIVLDDEQSIQNLLRVILESEGHDVFTTDDGALALKRIQEHGADLVIQDLRMPKMDGLAFLRQLKERYAGIPSIVLTAFGTLESTIEAMRLGAYTHLNKPFDTEEIRQTVSRALERLEVNRRAPKANVPFLEIISKTSLMAQVSTLINRVAPTDSTVLITGESGTGKELVARAIHFLSLRADQQFNAVNCGAFTETLLESELFGHVKGSFTNAIADRKGVFEMADRSTLFLDEVGETTLPTQVKLLRILETRSFRPVGGNRDIKVDVRFITATNRNLTQMCAEGQFREDLFYRLNVIPIELPPLRERTDDIPLLAGHFLAQFAKRMNKPMTGIDEAAIDRLLAHNWPGNVRELENTIERAVALCTGERITIADLPAHVADRRPRDRRANEYQPVSTPPPADWNKPRSTPSGTHFNTPSGSSLPATAHSGAIPGEGFDLERHLMELERAYILQALEQCNWNLTESARLLNMTFRSIRYKVSKLGIERPTREAQNP
jgi:two-component system, NtrC family, response regulator PilR